MLKGSKRRVGGFTARTSGRTQSGSERRSILRNFVAAGCAGISGRYMGLPLTKNAMQEWMMTKFQPTPDQQRIIDAGNRWFEESHKPGTKPYSKQFVAKCTSEISLGSLKLEFVIGFLAGWRAFWSPFVWLYRVVKVKTASKR